MSYIGFMEIITFILTIIFVIAAGFEERKIIRERKESLKKPLLLNILYSSDPGKPIDGVK